MNVNDYIKPLYGHTEQGRKVHRVNPNVRPRRGASPVAVCGQKLAQVVDGKPKPGRLCRRCA